MNPNKRPWLKEADNVVASVGDSDLGDCGRGRRRGGRRDADEEKWVPVTKLGRLVTDGKISKLEEVYLPSLPI